MNKSWNEYQHFSHFDVYLPKWSHCIFHTNNVTIQLFLQANHTARLMINHNVETTLNRSDSIIWNFKLNIARDV